MTEKPIGAMSWLVLAAVVLAIGAGAVAISVTGERRGDTGTSAKVAETNALRIPVQGMTCAVCAANVKKALQSVQGVEAAEVDLERREARVRYGEGEVSPERLVDAINRLGFKAGTPFTQARR